MGKCGSSGEGEITSQLLYQTPAEFIVGVFYWSELEGKQVIIHWLIW
jgi:hypothetical protein